MSVQVLTEFTDVAARKYGQSWEKIRDVLSMVRGLCKVESVTLETHRQALAIAERYRFRIYDSMIVAAALIANCKLLYSEDMQDAQIIGALRIRNPFEL